MSTAAATPINQNRNGRTMVEATAPEMFKFVKQGEELTGVLINIDQITVKDSPTIEYTVEDEHKQRVTFLGTNDLNKKIRPEHIGHFLGIRYERDDNSFTKPGQSAAKVFKVFVSKEKEPGY